MKIKIEHTIPPHQIAEIRADIRDELLSQEEGNNLLWLEYEPEIRALSGLINGNQDANTVISWAGEYKRMKEKWENQEISMQALIEERDYLAYELKKIELL